MQRLYAKMVYAQKASQHPDDEAFHVKSMFVFPQTHVNRTESWKKLREKEKNCGNKENFPTIIGGASLDSAPVIRNSLNLSNLQRKTDEYFFRGVVI